MFSSYKKTYWIIFVFLFVLVLTVTMVVYFDLTSVFQREAKTVVTAPINIEKTKSIQPNSNNSNVIISERPDTEVARSEEIDIELNREIVPAEPNISNIETLCSEEIDIGQDNAIISAETHISETESSVPNETITDNTGNGNVRQNSPVREMQSLFIGDSRTMGLANYASVENANYFAAAGMSVYNVLENRVSMPQIGKVTLEELLNHKKYDIIYVMLGINELGYVFEKTVDRYEMLVEYVMELQPEATIVLMANIHVTAERSETDKYINNPAIDRFNEATAKLTDSKTIFYLDANILFDDENGNLAKEKSSDSAHLKAKYCVQWAEWLDIETTELILQAEGEKGDG